VFFFHIFLLLNVYVNFCVSPYQASPALVSVLDDTRHNLSDGDVVRLDGVNGMPQLSGQSFKVTVKVYNIGGKGRENLPNAYIYIIICVCMDSSIWSILSPLVFNLFISLFISVSLPFFISFLSLP
jgi:hypothetical protein